MITSEPTATDPSSSEKLRLVSSLGLFDSDTSGIEFWLHSIALSLERPRFQFYHQLSKGSRPEGIEPPNPNAQRHNDGHHGEP